MSHWLLFAGIMVFAAFTQRLTGFGLALVSVPLLVNLLPVVNVAPLLALFGLIVNASILLDDWDQLQWDEVWRLGIALVPSIPIGVWALRNVKREWVLGVLGTVLIGYGLYALCAPRLPRIKDHNWAFTFGFLAGMLGGAYNTTGPPAVIYGTSRNWSPLAFKANLQAFFFLGNVIGIVSHALSGNINWLVWRHLAVSVPAALLGIWIGGKLESHLSPKAFRQIVQIGLVAMGVTLII
jgi:hypothetical protein